MCTHACLDLNMPLCTVVSVWKSEDSVGKLVLSSPRGSQASNPTVRLSSEHLPLLGHLVDPCTRCQERTLSPNRQAGLQGGSIPLLLFPIPSKNTRGATGVTELMDAEAPWMPPLTFHSLSQGLGHWAPWHTLARPPLLQNRAERIWGCGTDESRRQLCTRKHTCGHRQTVHRGTAGAHTSHHGRKWRHKAV